MYINSRLLMEVPTRLAGPRSAVVQEMEEKFNSPRLIFFPSFWNLYISVSNCHFYRGAMHFRNLDSLFIAEDTSSRCTVVNLRDFYFILCNQNKTEAAELSFLKISLRGLHQSFLLGVCRGIFFVMIF